MVTVAWYFGESKQQSFLTLNTVLRSGAESQLMLFQT